MVFPKYINYRYIDLVKTSDLFVRDILAYIQDEFRLDYEKAIDNKIQKLVIRWEMDINQSSGSQEIVSEICDYVRYNSKCKLPWNMGEINKALSIVKGLLVQ